MRKGLVIGGLVLALSYVGCGAEHPPACEGAACENPPPSDGGNNGNNGNGGNGGSDGGTDETDGGTGGDDGGTGGTDGGTDGGTGGTDGGTGGGTDGGTDGGTEPEPEPGPEPTGPQSSWPTDALKNYSTAYNIPRSVKSVGIDDGHNLWFLEGERIGVLTSESGSVKWSYGVGQFRNSALTTGSTVICGGEAGRAYVGHGAPDTNGAEREDPNDPEFMKGDLDLVGMSAAGEPTLVEHVGKTTSTAGYLIGLRNTNDWHYDEDRIVLSCVKAYRGPAAGSVFVGTNHGVTRVVGDTFNSHVHPVWFTDPERLLGMRAGWTYGLGIAANGEVLIANDWMIGRVTTPAELKNWDDHNFNLWRLKTHIPEVNSLEDFDFWRGIVETPEVVEWQGRSARYLYLGNTRPDGQTNAYGIWRLLVADRKNAADVKQDVMETVKLDFPYRVTSMVGTDDGSVFVGTLEAGLHRIAPDKTITRVTGITGSRVKQVVYDPTASPSMLLVLTDSALWVLRGH